MSPETSEQASIGSDAWLERIARAAERRAIAGGDLGLLRAARQRLAEIAERRRKGEGSARL
jgi:hypothetical protein